MDDAKRKIAEKLGVDINEVSDLYEAENLIKDNKIEFLHNGVVYRVRKPTLMEQEKCNKAKAKKYLELIDNPDFLFKEQWIAKYKEKGIDLFKIEDDIIEVQQDINQLLLRLATTETPKDIDTLKDELTKAREKQVELTIKKSDLLSYSIEDNLAIFINSYMTYLVLDKKLVEEGKEDTWVIAFNTYEDFENCTDMKLINKVFKYSTTLLYSYEN